MVTRENTELLGPPWQLGESQHPHTHKDLTSRLKLPSSGSGLLNSSALATGSSAPGSSMQRQVLRGKPYSRYKMATRARRFLMSRRAGSKQSHPVLWSLTLASCMWSGEWLQSGGIGLGMHT